VRPVFRPREVLVTQREASIERIREVLGWEPTVELEEGLASVVEHLKVSGELN
jgi:UDP-glucose 4-epimerase